MKQDITNRKDIEKLIDAFYSKATQDELIGHFFTTVMKIDWEKHNPIKCIFWENTLFFSGGYTGDMMGLHKAVHQKSAMNSEHFERWTFLFCQTVDELFEGENAERAKQRALGMATMLQIKIG
jgi:hemoglobin